MDGVVSAAVQKIVFRCDASKQIGSGHVMRCMTLAAVLKEKGWNIAFACSPETLSTVAALKNSGYDLYTDDTIPACDWLIVDHYGLDANFEKNARLFAHYIGIIDDLADRKHDCDLLLDQTFGRTNAGYKNLTPENAILLLGADYALLRPDFAERRKNLSRLFTAGCRVLASFGGVNPKSVTESALAMLSRYDAQPLEIDVVIGAGAAGIDTIKNLVAAFNKDGFHKAVLHIDTPHIADLMEHADICLGAGGTTSWERCCLGLPTLAIELADNQAPTLKALSDFGALVNLGSIEDLHEPDFLQAFSDLMAAPNIRETMSGQAMMVCDGRGAERVACTLLPPETAKDGGLVQMRYALPSDMRLIFDMQCAPGVRTHARNPEPPTWDDHGKWYASTMVNPHRHLFVVLHKGKEAGLVRLDREERNTYEVSILISPEFQGKGVAVAALNLLRSYKASAIFRAEILPGNNVSHNIFDKAGYQSISNGWFLSEPAKQE